MTILLIVLILALAAPSIYFIRKTLYPTPYDYDNSLSSEVEKGLIHEDYVPSLDQEDVYLYSSKGQKLHGIYIKNDDSKKTVIISHGYKCNLNGSYKYYKIFQDLGYNGLLINHRYHGLSEGHAITFGYHEKEDLKSWTDWVEDKHGPEAIIGTHGESMGAASVLLHGGIDPRINFIISDCPYHDLTEQLKYRLKIEYKLPAFPILFGASFFNYIHNGFMFRDVSPINTVNDISAPILFIHGKEDRYVPTQCTQNLYDSFQGKKSIFLVDNARHAGAYLENSHQYTQEVQNFLNDLSL